MADPRDRTGGGRGFHLEGGARLVAPRANAAEVKLGDAPQYELWIWRRETWLKPIGARSSSCATRER